VTGEPGAKHYAYAPPKLAAELHRHHVYRVQMNNQPKYPQILRIVEEIAAPKKHPQPLSVDGAPASHCGELDRG
jgi:hypothetical protein